jgi:hypothetical protein
VIFEHQVSRVIDEAGEEHILTLIYPEAREQTLVAAKTTAEALARGRFPNAANEPVRWRCLLE